MKRLSHAGLITMEDVAFAEEEQLYRMFGVDAELLIDHAWGFEPVTMDLIKAYKPEMCQSTILSPAARCF